MQMAANMEIPSDTIHVHCGLCGESYDDPKQLPCVHVFCKKCLQDAATKTGKNTGDTMPCPKCEESFSIPAEGFDGLQTDFFVSRLTKPTLEDRCTCDSCLERSPDAPDMEVPEDSATRVECRCKIQLEKAGSWKNTDPLAARDCPHHPREKLNFYCSECQKVLCNLCFDESHQNHRLQGTRSAAAKFCDEFQNSGLLGCSTQTLQRIEELKLFKHELGVVAKDLRESVRTRKENIKELLDKHLKLLLEDIELEERRVQCEHDRMRKDHEKHLTCLETFETYCRDLTTRGSPDDVCWVMTNLKRRSDELIKRHSSLIKSKTQQYDACNSFKFRESELEQFFGVGGLNIIGSIPASCRQRPIKETKDEEIARLKERVGELRKENRRLIADMEKLKQQALEHEQRSTTENEERVDSDAKERVERSRLEINLLHQQLEQIAAAKQLLELQLDLEVTRHLEELVSVKLRSDTEIGQLRDDISMLTKLITGGQSRERRRRYQVDKEFSWRIMEAKRTAVDMKITGLAVLEGELFITKCQSNEVQVRNLANLQTLKRRVIVNDLGDPYDISSCPQKQCLYIFDRSSMRILSIDKTGNLTRAAWLTKGSDGTLSVAADSNVILILHRDNNLIEYDWHGNTIKDIELYEYGIDCPWHAVKLNQRYYVVGHGAANSLQRVCMADVEEGATIMSFGEDLDWPMRRGITPCYFARAAAGCFMVTDQTSNRILLLKPTLEFDRVVIKDGVCGNWPEEHMMPERICLDEACNQIVVASNSQENGHWAGAVMSYQFD